MFLGAELPGARVCHRQSPGTEAELTTGGEGDVESKFPSAAGCLGGGGEGAGGGGARRRRQQMTTTLRQLANSSAPGAAAAAAAASIPTRTARRRLVSSAPGDVSRGQERRSERTGRKAARRRETESHRWPGQGRRDAVARARARVAQSRTLSLKRLQGSEAKVWWPGRWGGRARASRVLAVHPVSPSPLAIRLLRLARAQSPTSGGPNARGVRVWQRVRGCVCVCEFSRLPRVS